MQVVSAEGGFPLVFVEGKGYHGGQSQGLEAGIDEPRWEGRCRRGCFVSMRRKEEVWWQQAVSSGEGPLPSPLPPELAVLQGEGP